MTESPSLKSRASPYGLARRLGVSALSLAFFTSFTGNAYAAITNTATPNGTPSTGSLPTPAPTATVNVPVAPAAPALTITSKSGAAPVETGSDGVINAGDTITWTYVIQNSGNVTINSVAPLETGTGLGARFNSTTPNGTGSFSAFTLVSTTNAATTGATLAPGESGTWTAVYTLSAVDAYRAAGINIATGNGAENRASATGTPVTGTLAAVTPVLAEVAIPANPRFSIVKSHVFTTDAAPLTQANVGDVIRYKYEVTNAGNVAINNVSVSDEHEGTVISGQPLGENILVANGGQDGPLAPGVTSTDAAANNGTWSVLQPGARVIFFYDHTVTQAEVDDG
jgi:hypothetical protein